MSENIDIEREEIKLALKVGERLQMDIKTEDSVVISNGRKFEIMPSTAISDEGWFELCTVEEFYYRVRSWWR